MDLTPTYHAIDARQFEALCEAAKRHFQARFAMCDNWTDAFLVVEQVKESGLIELADEMTRDLKYFNNPS